ncbi:MAG: hypothetical protein KJZ96_17440 [Rhodocyclaceae bacterium]|nr:hypothetical protein [Rhodocyclaceae bacterium]
MNKNTKPTNSIHKLDEQALGAAFGGQSLLLNESMLAEEQRTDLLQGAVLDLESKGVGITHDHLPTGVGITHDHLPAGIGITNDHSPIGVGITHDHLPTGIGVTNDHAPAGPGGPGASALPGGLDADAGNPTAETMLGEKGGLVASGSGSFSDPYKGEDGNKVWDKVGGWKETDTALIYKSEGMQKGDPGVAIWTDEADPDTGKKIGVFLSDEELKEIEQKALEDLNKPSGDKSGEDGKAPTKEGGKETTTDGEGTSVPGDVAKDLFEKKLGGSNPLVRTMGEGQTFTMQHVTPDELDALLNPVAPMDPDATGTSGDVGKVAGFSVEKLHDPLVNPSGN